MNKILSSILIVGLMSVSAMALEGKVADLKFDGESDTIKFTLNKTAGGATSFYPIVATSPEMIKSLTASVLTAKSADITIDAYIRNINGTQGWTIIILK